MNDPLHDAHLIARGGLLTVAILDEFVAVRTMVHGGIALLISMRIAASGWDVA